MKKSVYRVSVMSMVLLYILFWVFNFTNFDRLSGLITIFCVAGIITLLRFTLRNYYSEFEKMILRIFRLSDSALNHYISWLKFIISILIFFSILMSVGYTILLISTPVTPNGVLIVLLFLPLTISLRNEIKYIMYKRGVKKLSKLW